jgi:hypothetical protein
VTPNPIVFLVNVDNTLLDDDHIQNDLSHPLEREFGAACRDLLGYDLLALLAGRRSIPSAMEVTR